MLLQVSHLTFSYPGSDDPVFDDVSFQFDTDWKLGFIGRNGRGKTTFLDLLRGRYPYQGRIAPHIPCDFFPRLLPDSGVLCEQALLSLCPDAPLWQVKKELSLLGLPEEVLSRPYDTLSHGERTKFQLAALFCASDRYLLIDEPTNHLDAHGRRLVSGYLRGKQGFLLVSHDRAFLDGCIDHVLSLNRANIEVQRGTFSTWQRNKAQQDESERARNQKLKQEVRRLSTSARRTSQWSDAIEKRKTGTRNSGLRPDRGYLGHQAAKMMQRAKNVETRREKALEEKSALLRNIDAQPALRLSPLRHHAARLVQAHDLRLFYGDHCVCGPLEFTLFNGERVALTGPNGSGKSTFLQSLLGCEIARTGTLTLASGLVVSYVPQDTAHLSGTLAGYAVQHGLDESLFKALLRKLGFDRAMFPKDIASFSAGQKKKTALAHSLCQPAHLYLWDEPLNYIDVISRMQIESLLCQSAPTLLFVEHDAAFVGNVATRTLAF